VDINDRFYDETCYTCGATINWDMKDRHNDWHNELEKLREIVLSLTVSIARLSETPPSTSP